MAKYKEIKINMTINPQVLLTEFVKRALGVETQACVQTNSETKA